MGSTIYFALSSSEEVTRIHLDIAWSHNHIIYAILIYVQILKNITKNSYMFLTLGKGININWLGVIFCHMESKICTIAV